jgi:aspartate/methionine/tyrosine aminotransferase
MVSMFLPKAGFTCFPRYEHNIPSEQLCRELLKKEDLLLSPGIYFGKENHLRINSGSKKEMLVEGLSRLDNYLGGKK